MSRLTHPQPTSRRPLRPEQRADVPTDKLVELNLELAKAALSEAAQTTRAVLSVKDAQELLALQAHLLQPDAEKAAAYSRHVYDIASKAEESAAEAQKKFMQVADTTFRNAPAGTENTVALVKRAFAAANKAYETVHEASKQLAAQQLAADWQKAYSPQAALRAALRNIVEAAQTAPSGARLRKGLPPSDKIDQAAQTIEAAFSQIIEERLTSRVAPEGVRFGALDNYVPGYEAAVAAGAQARTEIFKRGDMLNSQNLADKLGVSRETVNQRRRNRELLALQHESRGFRYPAWQIEPGVRDAMAAVLVELGESADCWSTYLFFTQQNPLLSGATPLQALKARKSAEVMLAATAMREELA